MLGLPSKLLSQIICFIGLFVIVSVAEASLKIAVIFPEVKVAGYNRIIDEIVSGIRSYPDVDVVTLPVAKDMDRRDVNYWVRDHEVEAIIALGQGTYELGRSFNKKIPVIHGGMLLEPNGHSGISLVADPERFFSTLRVLAPKIKRVYTVYSDGSNSWLIKLAKESAERHQLELVAYKENSLKSGMTRLKNIVNTMESGEDAMWLLLDKVVPDRSALPLVLEAAWERRFTVFSSNPSHTRRGALFALFPDHYNMGKNLAEMAYQRAEEKAEPVVVPLRRLKVAINERTASHLGYSYSQNQRIEFDLVYPVQ